MENKKAKILEEEMLELEGYDECRTVAHSCLHDCGLGGPWWSHEN